MTETKKHLLLTADDNQRLKAINPTPLRQKKRIFLLEDPQNKFVQTAELKKTLELLNYSVLVGSCAQTSAALQKTLTENRISLVLCFGMVQSADVVFHATYNKDKVVYRAPFAFWMTSADTAVINGKKEISEALKEAMTESSGFIFGSDEEKQTASKTVPSMLSVKTINTFTASESDSQSVKAVLDAIFPEKEYCFGHHRDVFPAYKQYLDLMDAYDSKVLQKAFIGQQLNDTTYKPREFKSKRVIDLACGSGILSLRIMRRICPELRKKADMQFYDYSTQVASSTYYNMIQEDFLDEVNTMLFKESDMFKSIPNPDNQQCVIITSLPQCPYPSTHKVLGKNGRNGGQKSLYFNEILLKNFSANFAESRSSLVMIYMGYSNPKTFFGLFQALKISIPYRTQHVNTYLTDKQYEDFHPGLAEYIKKFIAEEQSRVTWKVVKKEDNTEETVFTVPPQMLLVQKEIA